MAGSASCTKRTRIRRPSPRRAPPQRQAGTAASGRAHRTHRPNRHGDGGRGQRRYRGTRAPRRGRDRFGVVEDKVQKNPRIEQVYEFIRPMRTVGVMGVEDKKVVEIAEPFGVVAAIVPSTNPTSTAIYKVLIALKARCPIGISPHPSATR